MYRKFGMGLLVGTLLVAGWWLVTQRPNGPEIEDYQPAINPTEFTTMITNPLFAMEMGRKLTYESKLGEDSERIVIEMTGETKAVMGVMTTTYWDRVYVNDQLVEDTRDYLAQDSEGNVWYFGEEVDNYEDGQLVDHKGSWLAGVDGAKPGIWVKRSHSLGEEFRQEYYAGEAEDMVTVTGIGETVTLGEKILSDCVKYYAWTPLDPTSREEKYYCPEVGAEVLVVDLETGKRTELILEN